VPEGQTRAVRATVRQKGQLTLPADVRAALRVDEGDDVEFELTEDGDVHVYGLKTVRTSQAWFWTPSWQAGEREASEDIAAGRVVRHESGEAFLASLSDPSDVPGSGHG
jgi:AbrB family looped-hinge helix DNA binding protein